MAEGLGRERWAHLVHASGAGGKALDWLGDRFGTLKDDALSAYQGIADAFAAGDLALAVKDDQQRQLAQREARRQHERENAAELHNATLAQIGRQNMDRHQALDAEYAQRMADNEADLAAARQEWQAALAEARGKREAAEADAGLEGPGSPDDLLARARNALAGVGDQLADQAEKVGAKGTFNAAALAGLQGGDAADRTAEAAEQTAENTRRLVQAAQNGGLTFD